ncbi:acetyl-CoA carboxylase biotin carboxyl carrier protein [Bacillus alkalicellulosilyticus]|uniref:acetyl-CoA carboxylase biotin carboxyl carrier protein n=1 Tax=Alkalihalobacterium alkalicellulosilyticum TaxID=1912214 RepID=UPI000998B4DE|nr:acetyl-CoA carboxylase biotin carboxyl carrier protein [Bacillus alkalicellulosilyticus]
MLKIQEIRELIKLIDKSNIDEFKFEQSGTKITLKKQSQSSYSEVDVPSSQPVSREVVPQQAAVQIQTQKSEPIVESTPVESDSSLHKIVSPMVGTFYSAPSPDSDPYVREGDSVKETTVVCIVEAMKLMNEIEAEVKGKVVEVLAENGQLVEYGQPLFLVKPE